MEEKKIKFVTMFPNIENIHLVKDVGMIPYSLEKYYGYDSKIVVYKNRKYPYFENEVNLLSKDVYPFKLRKHNLFFNCIFYLIKNSKNIDVLHLYHPTNKKTRIYMYLYCVLNKKGLVYIHMDENAREKIDDLFRIERKSLKSKIKKFVFKKFSFKKSIRKRVLFGLQFESGINSLKGVFPFENIKYIPDAYEDTTNKMYNLNKENTILFVGRVGNPQKRTDILLDGFKKAYPSLKNWKLKIIGPIENDFKDYIEKFKSENKNISNNVEFVGPIYDRSQLKEEYSKAKIFCLTSDYESFGLVTVEALANGCTIVSSDILASKEIINTNEFGYLFKCGDSTDFKDKLIKACNDKKLQQYVQKNSSEYVDTNFSYKKSLYELNKWIQEKMSDKHEKK